MAVFHPDHDELHGFTVVITTSVGQTYVGRWHHEEHGRVLLNDVALHEEAQSEQTQEEFVKQTALWGVQVTHPQALVERETIVDVQRLGDVAKAVRGW